MNTAESTSIDSLFEKPARFILVTVFLLFLLLAGLVINANTGSVSIPAADVFRMIAQSLRYFIQNLLSGGKYTAELAAVTEANTASQILFRIRLPRVLLAALLGGALSVSGYMLQVFFRNPIAGPFVLGISSGAKMVVGVTLIFLIPKGRQTGSMPLMFSAFAGSLLITLLVLIFSRKVRDMSMLLVIGIMVGYICSAVTDFCVTFANEHDVINLTNWSMGSFSAANWDQVHTALLISLPCVIAAFLLSKPIEAYMLSEAYAASMGVPVKAFRMALLLVSSLLSACVTALAGPVSFVGIAVPHIARVLLRASKPRFLIPVVFLSGAVFCVFCDLIARTLFAPVELKIGTITSVFGAPVVIYLLIRRRRGGKE